MWCSDPSFLSLFMDCCRGNNNAQIHRSFHTVSFNVC